MIKSEKGTVVFEGRLELSADFSVQTLQSLHGLTVII